MVLSPSSGHRYSYEGAPVVVPDNNVIDIEVKAESPGAAYQDPAGTITVMVTPLPGLSVINRAQPWGGLAGGYLRRNPANQGSGFVVPTLWATPIQTRFYKLTVLASGQAAVGVTPGTGSVQLEYEQNAAATVRTTHTPIPSTIATTDGTLLTLNNGAGVGFVTGDIHTFSTPGSAMVANGQDDETNQAYAERMLGRWPSLSTNIVTDKYKAWVRQASLDSAFGIEKITVRPSNTIAGQTDVVVATGAGAPADLTIQALNAYLNLRNGTTDSAEVSAASNRDIVPSGTVFVRAAELDAAKAAADLAWQKYITDLPIGGDVATGVPGVVRLAELRQAVMDAGAVEHGPFMLNAVAANFALTTFQVATIPAGALPSQALTWVGI